jgi:large repetitive protein
VRRPVAALVVVCLGAIGVVSSIGPAFAATAITSPSSNPFSAPGDATGNPQAFTVSASGFAPGANVFVEQCDGVPATQSGWDAAQDCDLGSSPSPAAADASGNVTFNAADPNHAFTPFKGESPQSLFNCLASGESSPGNGLTDYTNCQLRVSTNNTAGTSDQVFLTLTLPSAQVAPAFTGTPTTADVNQPYSFSFTGITGSPAPTFSMTPASVAGITLSPAGVLSGTPNVSGSAQITVTASNGVAPNAVKTFTVSIAADPNRPGFLGAPAPATVGTPYTFAFTNITGTPTPTFSMSPSSFAGGITLSPAGVLSGTPATPGTFSVTVTATNGVQPDAVQAFTVTVGLSTGITTPTGNPIVVPGNAAGDPVAFTVVASGFVPGTNVFVEQCDGTPTTAVGWEPAQNCDVGSSPSPAIADTNGNATFLSTDSNHAFIPFKGASPQGLFNCLSPTDPSPQNGLDNFRNCQLRVSTNNVVSTSDQVLTTLRLPNVTPVSFQGTPEPATVGTPYNFAFTGITGVPAPTFSMSPSTLAGGITLSSSGVLSGNPTTAGTFSITVTASNGVAPNSVQSFTVPVGLTTAITTPTGSPFVVPGNLGGDPQRFTVVASGFVPGTNVFVEQCDGTPNTAIGWDPAQNCDVGSSPSPAIVDTNGNATFLSTDSNHAFTPFRDASPQGLFNCLSPLEASPNNGLADFRNCQLRVASNNVVSTSDQVFRTLQLPESVALVAPSFTGTPTQGTVGSPYSFSFGGITGNPAPSFTMTPATVAGGITVSSVGVLSGTPTTAGSFPITVTAANGVAPDAVKSLTLVIAPPVLHVTTVSLPAARVGVVYSTTVAAAGGVTPYHWSIATGTLPVGLTLNPSTGVISGTPKAAATSSFTVRDTDSATPTAQIATKALSIAVAPTANPALGKVGVPYWTTVAAFAGVAPYHWSVSAGALPTGLALNATTGVISGTPTAEGAFKPSVQVLDSKTPKAAKVITKLTISIAPVSITITPATLAHGTIGVKYTATLAGSGGVATYKFAVTSGALPPGIRLTPTGKLTGKPTTAGSFSSTVTTTDKFGFTGVRAYVFVVS